ncbi:MAG: SRPBCC family protein [Gammaproteobacteria bacterium]|nr:SRPBCC family protein [Gammaproteobacteria bacterium]
MSQFTESIAISAAPEAVWSALADIGNICEWNPGVKNSEQTSQGDVGVGATRRCQLGGRNYLNEEIILFEPGRRMSIRITDTNLPFKSAEIRFALTANGNQTIVEVTPDYQLKFGIIGRLLDALMGRSQYRKGMRELLQGLKEFVESRRAD